MSATKKEKARHSVIALRLPASIMAMIRAEAEEHKVSPEEFAVWALANRFTKTKRPRLRLLPFSRPGEGEIA